MVQAPPKPKTILYCKTAAWSRRIHVTIHPEVPLSAFYEILRPRYRLQPACMGLVPMVGNCHQQTTGRCGHPKVRADVAVAVCRDTRPVMRVCRARTGWPSTATSATVR